MDIVRNSRRDHQVINGAQPSTLIDVLISHAQTRGSDPAYTFLSEQVASQLTYSELEAQARSVAACLRRLANKGDRVLLLLPPGLEFVAGFCGCLYGGLVAVPAYPPHRNRGVLRLQAIAADCGARIILTTQSILKEVQPNFTSPGCPDPASWIAFEEIAPVGSADWRKPDLAHSDIGFLQYTSGSTATPKGVIVSHGNLMANEEKIRKWFGQSRDSVIVSWLPLYHDMGLIGSVLQSLYVGAHCILFSPVAFLQSPVKWLQAISHFRATTSGGPNFAYDLCVRKVTAEELTDVDLSSWAVAFNGAEPVRADTLERFASRFAVCGFRREAFRPCYGLAESTLLATVGGSTGPVTRTVQADALAANRVVDAAEDGNSRVLVGCGSIDNEEELRIVNPSTLAPCAPGEVGEIWLSGPSVAQGYWRKAEETKESFCATLNGDEGHFLRTGDLGVVVAGQVFVTGRLKDLIIIRGRNHYPQDIERTVELSHPALRQGCGAAFSVEVGQEERLVVVQEIDRHDPAAAREAVARIKAAVSEEHELQFHAIALLQRGAVPKTSSGKIQRHLCKSAFIAGTLPVVESWMENTAVTAANAEDSASVLPGQFTGAREIAEWMRSRIARRLDLHADQIDPQSSITRFGIDSLAAVELAHEIESALSVSLPSMHLFQETSIIELARILAQRRSRSASKTVDALPAAAAGNEQRPSRGQSAMWFLHRMAPESTAYNIAAAASICSALQVETLRQGFEQIVARHDSLRTVFPAHDGRPMRRVLRQVPGFFQHVDASGWTEARLDEELSKEANRKFDLENGPLFRILIFSAAPDRYVLLMVAHHIIADFWSLSVVLRELGALYAGQANLLPAPLSFDQYVHWQENMLSSSEGQQHWSFWDRQFSGEIEVLDLPTDYTRPAMQTHSGAAELLAVDRGLTLWLRHLAKSHGATLYTVLLSAFEVLLYRYTRQACFMVGTPVANRNLLEFSGLVGLVANTVAVKVEISGDLTAAEFMDRTRVRVLAALEHQEYPFALLVERLQPVRDPGRSPLFPVMFAINKVESRHARHLGSFTFPGAHCTIDLGGLILQSRPLPQRSSQFDLTLRIVEDDEGLASCFEYNTRLFEPETVRRMAGHYHRLLDAITQNPSQLIKDLPLLTNREEEELLMHWNHSTLEVPITPMHVLFEEQARRTPEAIAVVFEGEELTYAELDRRANQLAHYLRGRAIGPESRVGVCLERSLDLLVVLLAVFKAGGAYVPMDPEYPAERLSFMMRDASMCAVVTLQRLQGKFARPADLIFVDAAQKQIARMSVDSLGAEVSPSNAAYVIYTSGSTGVPKGVIVHHLGLVNLLWDMRGRLGISEKDRWLSVTTVSFDIAGLELYLPLITGAQLWLAGSDDVRSGKRLRSLLEQSRATIMQATPVTWQSLIEEGWPGTPGLTALCGGEAMPRVLAHDLLVRTSVVWNVYGPTETTIWSSGYRLRSNGDRVMIGNPLANTQLYVLDQEHHLVPAGVTGELYISGAGVARGYLHRPDLTVEKFIPDPFGEPGARLYKTGDVARYRSDGNVEFLGRADNQVKFRGFRIELGEIEACLGRHPAVEQVAVVRRGDAGKERLVGYLVLRPGIPCADAELRDFVKQSLPEYMMPSVFVALPAMPLTPNGKINRNGLPLPEQDARRDQLTASRNATEEILVGIWRQVLRTEQVGITDNFFELGGHSLLAAQVNSRIAAAFGVELPLQAFFEYSTIEALARRIQRSSPEDRAEPPLQPGDMAGALAGNPESALAPSSTIRRVTQMREEFLMAQIESMSEQEVDNLIETLSAAESAANAASS
jgi:amino acid adenylation domain-containing protein